MLIKLMIINTFNSLLILMMKHPLSLGISVLLQASLISLILGFFNLNFWFSYILFLIMIGGMMILFIYMTSVASNEKFKISLMMIFTYFMMMMMMMFMFMIPQYPNYLINLNNIYMESIKLVSSHMTLNKFLNMPLMFTLIMIFIYLLITLIATVKISSIQNGPMRQKF